MRLVEEEDQARLVGIADLRQFLEQFRQQPQQEGGIERRVLDDAGRVHDIDLAAAIGAGAHHVVEVECRFAEEILQPLAAQHQQTALDGADRCRGDIAIGLAQLGAALGNMHQKGAQILEVEQKQVLVFRQLEGDIEHTFLGVIEIEHAREQQRPHLRDRGAQRMTARPEHIPEHAGRGRVGVILKPDRLGARDQLGVKLGAFTARGGHAGQIALHIGDEDRNAGIGKALGEDLQRYRLAGAGGAGDQAVPIRALEQERLGCAIRAANEDIVQLPLPACVFGVWPNCGLS